MSTGTSSALGKDTAGRSTKRKGSFRVADGESGSRGKSLKMEVLGRFGARNPLSIAWHDLIRAEIPTNSGDHVKRARCVLPLQETYGWIGCATMSGMGQKQATQEV